MVGGGARAVVASGVPISPNRAGHRRIAAAQHLYIASGRFGTRANRRSQRADGLHFGS